MRKIDNDALENLMMVMVAQVTDAFNVKEKFTPEATYECALLIIEKFWYLRPEEVLYCFKQAKTGKYGPVYGRVDTPTIMEWLTKYDNEERLAAVEAARIARQSEEIKDQQQQHEAIKSLYPDIAKGEVPLALRQSALKREQKKEAAQKEHEYTRFKMIRDENKQEPLF